MAIQAHISSHTLPDERQCIICNEPVKLQTVKCDENGKVVHEKCYFDKIKSEQPDEGPHTYDT